MTWEQEKAYTEKRAQELKEQMEQATIDGNLNAFLRAYNASARYMKKKQREDLYVAFIKTRI